MDYIPLPYIAYMRDAGGFLFRVAWAECNPGAKVFPSPHCYASSRHDPNLPLGTPGIGELPTDTFEWSPYKSVPETVCGDCYSGVLSWYGPGGWPDGTPGVVLDQDGFSHQCKEGGMGTVMSVGLAADGTFIVSGSPVTTIGVLSLDWADVPAGYSLQGPTSGPAAKPTFKPTGSSSPTRMTDWWTGEGLSSLAGLGPFGGASWTLAADETIYLTNQADERQNGPWVAKVTSWVRPSWFSGTLPFALLVASRVQIGVLAPVDYIVWFVTSTSLDAEDPIIVGTTLITQRRYSSISSLSMPSAEFGVITGVNGDGRNFSVTWDVQAAGSVFSGPSSGPDDVPTFKPLAPAHIPQLPSSQIDPTSGAFPITLIPSIPGNTVVGPPIPISVVPPGVPKLLTYVVNGSAFSGAAPQTIHIDTLPAGLQIMQVTYKVTTAWNGAFGPPGSMQLGYSGGGGGASQAAEWGTVITLGTVNNQIVGGYDNAYQPNIGGSWFFDVTIPAYAASLTGITGQIVIFVVAIET